MSNDVPATVPSEYPGLPRQPESRLYESASDWNRRFVLAYLEESGGPVAEEDLATALAADEHDKPSRLVTDEERETVLAKLRHVHLPKLDDAGLIERNGNDVLTGDRSTRPNDPLPDAIEDGDGLDPLYEAVSDSLRRELVVALAERREDVLGLEEAADAVLDRSPATCGTAERSTDEVVVSLHHHHLPKLDDAGIVSYDADERRILYEGHDALHEERL